MEDKLRAIAEEQLQGVELRRCNADPPASAVLLAAAGVALALSRATCGPPRRRSPSCSRICRRCRRRGGRARARLPVRAASVMRLLHVEASAAPSERHLLQAAAGRARAPAACGSAPTRTSWTRLRLACTRASSATRRSTRSPAGASPTARATTSARPSSSSSSRRSSSASSASVLRSPPTEALIAGVGVVAAARLLAVAAARGAGRRRHLRRGRLQRHLRAASAHARRDGRRPRVPTTAAAIGNFSWYSTSRGTGARVHVTDALRCVVAAISSATNARRSRPQLPPETQATVLITVHVAVAVAALVLFLLLSRRSKRCTSTRRRRRRV